MRDSRAGPFSGCCTAPLKDTGAGMPKASSQFWLQALVSAGVSGAAQLCLPRVFVSVFGCLWPIFFFLIFGRLPSAFLSAFLWLPLCVLCMPAVDTLPEGLRGWVQVPRVQTAWAQIPQVSYGSSFQVASGKPRAQHPCHSILSSTPKGFEPLRAEPIGFWVQPRSRSDTNKHGKDLHHGVQVSYTPRSNCSQKALFPRLLWQALAHAAHSKHIVFSSKELGP